MADLPPNLDSSGKTDDANATPRWVYGFGIIAFVVVVVFVVLHLTGGGFRGHTLP